MKRILNIIGIFFLSIIVFTGCQNFTEDEMEMSPQTRAQLSSGTHYYWYKGNKIPITINTTKSYILFESSDEANLQLPLLNSKSGLSAAKVTLSSRLQLQDATRSAANDNLYWAEVATADVNAQDKALVYSAPYFKTSDGADLGLSHLFYVKVKSIRDVRILTTLATENKVTLLGNNEYLPLWYTLSCTNESLGNALEMANKFYEDGPFAPCQPCFISEDETTAAPNDPLFSAQWALKNTGQNQGTAGIDINYLPAREVTQGSSDIIVAVLDHGTQLDHPDLNVSSKSYDTETGRSPSQIWGNHGTACSGIISAKTNNNLGVAGIAPNCPVMSISNQLMGTSDAPQKRADGFNWAWRNGASVISNSWRSSTFSELLEDAIQSAMTNGRNGLGCVVTFSAGNYDSNTVGYPARSLPDIIVVGALSLSGKRKSSTTIDNEGWWGSDYGTQLDIMAPGVLIYTTDRTGSVGYVSGDYMPNFNGTSSACPHVAGVAALILSVNPNLTQKEVATIIEKTARKVGGYSYSTVSGRPNGTWHTEVGYGLIDAYAAVMEAQNASTTVYFNDKTVTTNTVVSGSEISATNVTVKNNAKLTFTNAKSIIITQPFTVELTSSLELSLQ